MSGLDKISDTILREAQNKAEGILAKAKEQAEAISKHTAQKIEGYDIEYRENTQKELQAVQEKYASENRQARKQAILKTRSMVIEDTINKAKHRLETLPEDEYFDFLRHVCVKNAQAGEGELYFSKKDYDRLPGNFAEKCNSEIKNGSVVLKGSLDTIENGFIIMYGKIEQNCSIDSIFESNKNLLLDTANSCIQQQA